MPLLASNNILWIVHVRRIVMLIDVCGNISRKRTALFKAMSNIICCGGDGRGVLVSGMERYRSYTSINTTNKWVKTQSSLNFPSLKSPLLLTLLCKSNLSWAICCAAGGYITRNISYLTFVKHVWFRGNGDILRMFSLVHSFVRLYDGQIEVTRFSWNDTEMIHDYLARWLTVKKCHPIACHLLIIVVRRVYCYVISNYPVSIL